MKRFTLVIALICALSASASAGDIPSGGIAPPPPPDPVRTVVGASGSTETSALLPASVFNLLQAIFWLI